MMMMMLMMMKKVGTATTLIIVASVVPFVSAKSTFYHADLGDYGTFELEISEDDSSMSWKSTLTNIDMLETALGGGVEITSLNYHLHQQWTTANSDFGIGSACGPAITGGHYDPFFGCGPASAVPSAQCDAIGKPTASYSCTPAIYANGEYSKCEVGDLSGKSGPIPIPPNGDATNATQNDPFAALVSHYVGERVTTDPGKFASIVFHNGGPRVLCGKLEEGKKEDDGFLGSLLELIFWCF